MRNKRNSKRSWNLVLALIPLLAISTVAGAAFLPSTAVATGHWVLSDVQDCPEGLVCTEWQLASGERKDIPCCQDPSMVGSTAYHDCTGGGGYFRQ